MQQDEASLGERAATAATTAIIAVEQVARRRTGAPAREHEVVAEALEEKGGARGLAVRHLDL